MERTPNDKYPSDYSTHVYVLTFGPGDHPFFMFGHNAIWIRDTARDEKQMDRVYNFGTFKFDSPRLILDFLGGRLTYWLSVSSSPRAVFAGYQRENRSIAIQELRLDNEQRSNLETALELNARPENRAYKYDYFLDNCSTRVRDVIDGERSRISMTDVGKQPGRMTLREHALRMTAGSLPFYLALDIVLGPKVDRPTDRWAEMFLPEELARGLGDAQNRLRGSMEVWGEKGFRNDPVVSGPMPLVSRQTVLFEAARPPIREAAPRLGTRFFAAGLAFGLVMLALGWAGRWRRAARIALGILVAFWGLVVGFIGCFLIYVWAFTDHVVAHRNQNILICAPWAIALFVLGIGVAMGRPGATRKALALAVAAVGAVLAACALKAGIVVHQENGALIAFFVPAWLGVAAALLVLRYATALGTTALGASRP